MITLTQHGEDSVGQTGCQHCLLGPPSSRNHKSRSVHPKVSPLHAMRHLPCRVGIAEDTNQGGRAQQRKDPELYMNNVVKPQAAQAAPAGVRPTADNASCWCFLIFPMFSCRWKAPAYGSAGHPLGTVATNISYGQSDDFWLFDVKLPLGESDYCCGLNLFIRVCAVRDPQHFFLPLTPVLSLPLLLL